MENKLIDFGKRLFELRNALGKSKTAFAEELGIVHQNQWLEGQRTKGEARNFGSFKLPLHKVALALIEKWQGIEAFCKIARSHVNENLLEVEKASGVALHLTTKLGRSTFAHHALNLWGVSIETVAKMMGHYSTQTTQRFYVKVNTEKIDRDTVGKM